MTQARLELEPYTIRVLDVIKGKFGLKNRTEAINKFAEECGDQFVEIQIDESILKDLDHIYDEHMKLHPKRRMNDKELNELLGI